MAYIRQLLLWTLFNIGFFKMLILKSLFFSLHLLPSDSLTLFLYILSKMYHFSHVSCLWSPRLMVYCPPQRKRSPLTFKSIFTLPNDPPDSAIQLSRGSSVQSERSPLHFNSPPFFSCSLPRMHTLPSPSPLTSTLHSLLVTNHALLLPWIPPQSIPLLLF